jgi:hypothetical protein
MNKSNTEWSPDGSHIPKLEPHTKAKHQIYEEYIENLIITLYGKTRYGETQFTIVDGFCGGGIYSDPETNELWEGSPIRIIKAVRKAFFQANRKLELNVKYIFIDRDSNHLNCLKNFAMPSAGLERLTDGEIHITENNMTDSLEENKLNQLVLGDLINPKNSIYLHSSGILKEQCEFICGEFESQFKQYVFKIINIRGGHSLFILDPFSWEHISMNSIRMIGSLKGSEIIYTYMIKKLKWLVIGKNDQNQNKFNLHKFNQLMESDGFYESVDLKRLNKIEEQRYLRNETLRLFREQGKVQYAHTFSLIPKGYHAVLYYLMHFSKNLTALQVMRDTLWKYNNLSHTFEFEVYGFGLKTVDYYKRENLKLDFTIENTFESYEECIKVLDNYLGQYLHKHKEGESFRNICDQTMQLNPGCLNHYEDYLNRKIADKEIEVVRNENIISGKGRIKLQNKDIIRVTGNKQLYLF